MSNTFRQSGELDVKWSRPAELVLGLDGQFVFCRGRQSVKLMDVIEEHASLLRILLVSLKQKLFPVSSLKMCQANTKIKQSPFNKGELMKIEINSYRGASVAQTVFHQRSVTDCDPLELDAVGQRFVALERGRAGNTWTEKKKKKKVELTGTNHVRSVLLTGHFDGFVVSTESVLAVAGVIGEIVTLNVVDGQDVA